jgi:hypothetical protein
MNVSRLIFWSLVAATCAVYAAMIFGTIPAISDAAGGLAIFDMRPRGYPLAEAAAFLGALSAEGRALYLGAQHRLDAVFPGLLAVTAVWALWRLTPDWPAWARVLLLALPVVASSFDYIENFRVAALLDGGAVTAETVAAASRASVAKAALTTLAYTALIGLVIWRARGWLRR